MPDTPTMMRTPDDIQKAIVNLYGDTAITTEAITRCRSDEIHILESWQTEIINVIEAKMEKFIEGVMSNDDRLSIVIAKAYGFTPQELSDRLARDELANDLATAKISELRQRIVELEHGAGNE